ncbi:hypothetical protein Taro_018820 [Colocasia esculenta]|uniref:Uncharacterized protein n=1 Tax=Colocasia esculenta TaxID=4460 RepID=A0A843URR5_COLES|nr:hypothetical protein [Colocasia esculenta]
MGRAPCCDKNGLKKGPWTPEEDQKLLDYIQKHGHGKWRMLPKNAGEWSAIAAQLPGRTDNEVKNFWNTHIRKRLLRMGIDPVTHSPRLDLLDLSSLLTPSLYGNPSQLDISRLLGVQPALNAELLMVASSLLLAQRQNVDLYLLHLYIYTHNAYPVPTPTRTARASKLSPESPDFWDFLSFLTTPLLISRSTFATAISAGKRRRCPVDGMGRAPCCDKNGLKKGPWTPEEDQKLLDYIKKHGHGRWRTLPKNAGLSRCGKSCRLRWTNYLRPDIKRGKFSIEEEETIIQLHSILGNKWSAIAARLPGRTDNEIKNFWNTHIRKRLLRMGIDPVTHSPRLDLLDLSSLLTPASLYGNPSQLEVSRLLGVEPAVNKELLRIATGLLSAQRQNAELLRQNLQEQQQQQQRQQLQQHLQLQFPNPTVQDQFQPPFSPEQVPNPVQQVPVCTTSCSAAVIDEAQLMQADIGQLLSGETFPCGLPESFLMPQNSEVFGGGAQAMDAFGLISSEAINHYGSSSSECFGFPSVLSTPASSATPLNSSSTYINSTGTGTTTEDERDSYCSGVLNNFHMPELLDVGVFM